MTAGTGHRGRATLAATVLVLMGGAGEAVGQDLRAAIEGAPDGYVRFEYATRPGVCGDGDYISIDEGRVWRGGSNRDERRCEDGPARIELRISGREVVDLDVEVGGAWRPRRDVTVLGEVDPAEAAGYLFDLAERSNTGAAEDALFPATIARGVEGWPRLLEIARTGSRRDVREQAVFWLGHEAGERAARGLVSIIEDEDELSLREHAVFALAQRPEPTAVDALIEVARESPEPALRKRAIFWLGQRGDDPRVLALFEELLRGG
ncbi:MAG: HEAT repeat domain-containing protein [Gemmatimonadota bacterium]|nr:HEAT repeat domain-containing protein [Gemmatimonadota bacterium]